MDDFGNTLFFVLAPIVFLFMIAVPIAKAFLRASFEYEYKAKQEQNYIREEERISYIIEAEKKKIENLCQKKIDYLTQQQNNTTYANSKDYRELKEFLKNEEYRLLKKHNELKDKEKKLSPNGSIHNIYELESKLKIKEKELNEKEDKVINKEKNIKTLEKRLIAKAKMLDEKTKGFPWVAEMYAMYMTSESKQIEHELRTKKIPAIKSADAVRESTKRAKDAEKKYFITLGLLKYYENIYPELEEFQDAPNEILLNSNTNEEQIEDPARELLTKIEWDSLTNSEKFQKSLENYCKRKKSNWEIGREYERFIGYEYEENGWHIKYYGATQGFCDLGRDLIAKKGSETHIIQCKYWAKEKTIHEKHIFQLYGTSILFMLENRLLVHPKSIFITSCQLSETAKRIAKYLKIEIIENKAITEYPRIKCNISKNGEKIYHLPFDQQYDRIRIEKDQGEFFCKTVHDAESQGFRRAFRWRSSC